MKKNISINILNILFCCLFIPLKGMGPLQVKKLEKNCFDPKAMFAQLKFDSTKNIYALVVNRQETLLSTNPAFSDKNLNEPFILTIQNNDHEEQYNINVLNGLTPNPKYLNFNSFNLTMTWRLQSKDQGNTPCSTIILGDANNKFEGIQFNKNQQRIGIKWSRSEWPLFKFFNAAAQNQLLQGDLYVTIDFQNKNIPTVTLKITDIVNIESLTGISIENFDYNFLLEDNIRYNRKALDQILTSNTPNKLSPTVKNPQPNSDRPKKNKPHQPNTLNSNPNGGKKQGENKPQSFFFSNPLFVGGGILTILAAILYWKFSQKN